MIFKWDYPPGPVGRDANSAMRLMMGTICVGEVYMVNKNDWRAECRLPDSGRDGGHFVGDYAWQGVAKSTLEIVAAMWVNKSGLWTI
ncbi:hypothetical protein H8U31_001264 [Salmonella enterica]|nr:hypothetical protein [Salmonella enterica]EGC0267514.1 hypothetical protein [Salmonella enterica]